MDWRTLIVMSILAVKVNSTTRTNQMTMALRIPPKCFPKFVKRGLYSVDKCMATCMMEVDEKICHGIEMDLLKQTCQHLTFNFTAVACLGSTFSKNKTGNEIYIKEKYIVNQPMEQELYFASLEDGQMYPISGLNQSLVDLTMPKSLLNRNDISVEYRNGVISCQVTNLKCFHWSFEADAYEPFPSLKRPHNTKEELAVFGAKLIVVGNTRSYDALESVHIFDPASNEWIFGPDLTEARIGVTIVTLNSTSVMAVAGQINRDESISFVSAKFSSKVEMLCVGDQNWTILADYPEPVASPACGTLAFPNGTKGVLCIGGKSIAASSRGIPLAYFFNLDTQEWKQVPEFDAAEGKTGGRIVQWNDEIFYKPEIKFNTYPDYNIYVKNLTKTEQPWQTHSHVFTASAKKIVPLKIRIFKFKP